MSNFHYVNGQLVPTFPLYYNTFEGIADSQSVDNEEVNVIKMGEVAGTVTLHFNSVPNKVFNLAAHEIVSVGAEVIAISSSHPVKIS